MVYRSAAITRRRDTHTYYLCHLHTFLKVIAYILYVLYNYIDDILLLLNTVRITEQHKNILLKYVIKF